MRVSIFGPLLLILTPVLAEAGERGALFEIRGGTARSHRVRRGRPPSPTGPRRGLVSRVLGCGTPRVFAIDRRRALLFWPGERAAWALAENRGGRLVELGFGAWPRGAWPAGVGDFDGDGRGDLVVLRLREDKGFEGFIASGYRGGFRLPGPGSWSRGFTVEAGASGFTIGDLNGDGFPDLVYLLGPREYTRTVVYRSGLPSGLPRPTRRRIAHVSGAYAALLGVRFRGRDRSDLVLLSDDHENREALLLRTGRRSVVYRSVRLADIVLAGRVDERGGVTGMAQTADIDGDGRLDLITREAIGESRAATRIRWGLGYGRFAERGPILEEIPGDAPSRSIWLEDSGPLTKTDSRPIPPDEPGLAAGLLSRDGAVVAKAIDKLLRRGDAALPLLRSLLFLGGDARTRLKRLLPCLDHRDPRVRDRASHRILELPQELDVPIARVRMEELSPEADWRLRRIIDARWHRDTSPRVAIGERRFRVLAVIEAIGGARARRLLVEVSKRFQGTAAGKEAGRILGRVR